MKPFTSAQLHIAEPCNQSWDEMKQVSGARFCSQCEKHVVDFTLMSDTAVLLYVKQKGLGCGRFREDQLGRVLPDRTSRTPGYFT